MKKAIITGITGQDGAYLSKFLLDKDYEVIGIVRGSSEFNYKKLEYLGIKNKIKFTVLDLLNYDEVCNIIANERPNEVYNLAAQSSVGDSFHRPEETYKFNIISVLNLLEAIRTQDKSIKFYQASSSEMFGKVTELPINESSILNPISPYGTSKAAAHWMVRDYRIAYSLFAVSGILFNHESYLRGDNFFVKKIIRQSIEIAKGKREYLEVGNIDVKRDFGFSPNYVEAMWKMLQTKTPEDFIISSGESICLKDIVFYVFGKLGIDKNKLRINKEFIRTNEIMDIYGDNSKAKKVLNWDYNLNFMQVLDWLIAEEISHDNL